MEELKCVPTERVGIDPRERERRGAGAYSMIFVQFLDGAGNELGAPAFVGRCNSLE